MRIYYFVMTLETRSVEPNMDKPRGRRVTDPTEFFSRGGSVWMKLSRSAARDAVWQAAAADLLVARLEGGIWRDPGFEARVDAIWDSVVDAPMTRSEMMSSNQDAANFITAQPDLIDTFIITTVKFDRVEP